MSGRSSKSGAATRLLLMLLLTAVALEIFFLARVVVMIGVDPQSTTFQRSEAFRLATSNGKGWRQDWVPYSAMSVHIKRAVIASEDDVFATHGGVQWDAVESAWQKNNKAQERAEQRAQNAAKGAQKGGKAVPVAKPVKIVGGSTITQQLAKNLLLSGERNLFRKAQELAITLALEAFLSKERILEIYLNNVEWGEGVFGIEAAAQHYFRKPAAQLGPFEAARLAVMLPRPKFFEKQPTSNYLSGRAMVIAGRMADVQVPR
jgi:monofunctional biosynthetic peptidoglycan transglycosylase